MTSIMLFHYAIKQSCPLHFADVTCLLNIQSFIKQSNRTLNKDLKQLALWLNANKISLNIVKKEAILFKPKNKQFTISNSNYVENVCILLPMLGSWVFGLAINLTGILILIILFQN